MEFKKICILGLGYIGLPYACTFATHGMKVVGMDINPQIVQSLQQGVAHIYEPGLRSLVTDALASGNLTVQAEVEPADAFIIAVPTPFFDDKRADLRAVKSAAQSIVPHLRRGNLVVLESTSPPLTTTNIVAPILEQSGLKAGEDYFLCYSPERVLPGQILRELIENARVIGGIDPASSDAGRKLYSTFVRSEIILTTATTAEMVKLMENTYRDINVAIANEFSRLADWFGIDVWEAIALANRHPRVKILRPGPGVGGHCVSVDPWFLVEAAPDLTPLICTARQVNDAQPAFVLELVRRALGNLAGKKIAVLGLAFKPNVDDLRESPAIDIAQHCQEEGAEVTAYEPYRPDANIPGLHLVGSLDQALAGADAILVLAGHTQFCQLQPAEVADLTSARVVIDAVHALDRQVWQQAGFRCFTLGVGQA